MVEPEEHSHRDEVREWMRRREGNERLRGVLDDVERKHGEVSLRKAVTRQRPVGAEATAGELAG